MSTITKTRFFTIADFEEEENWLREEHKKGHKLVSIGAPCFYHFEECTPEDVIYKLDYINKKETTDYVQMFEDYGWEHVGNMLGWVYFRKLCGDVAHENEGEIFSDTESRLEQLKFIRKTRLSPLVILFLCFFIPNAMRCFSMTERSPFYIGLTVFWCILLLIYTYLLVHCGSKIKRMENELEQ